MSQISLNIYTHRKLYVGVSSLKVKNIILLTLNIKMSVKRSRGFFVAVVVVILKYSFYKMLL